MLFADGNTLVDCVNVALAALDRGWHVEPLEEEYLVVGSDIPVITPDGQRPPVIGSGLPAIELGDPDPSGSRWRDLTTEHQAGGR